MISEARTSIVSWLKSPKTLAVKIGIGAIVAVVLSVPVVSVFALNSDASKNEMTEKSSQTESTADKVEPVQQETSDVDVRLADEQDVTSENADTPPNIPADPNTPAPVEPEPETPPAPVYTDTYPSNLKDAPVSSKFDQWGLDNRQSTSYTAWKVSETFGNMPKWGMTGNGNASNWPSLASSAGIATGANPKPHSVAVVNNFTAWVESVNGDNVTVSFYNWGNTGEFGVWENVSASKFSTYIYFGG